MPLIHSSSKKAIGENIAIERKHGKPEKQAIAIAFSEKRRAMAKKMGGKLDKFNKENKGAGKQTKYLKEHL